MARKLPEIPTATLADIAFLLLIFFLVTTTMDTDKGLERRLPQWVDPNMEIDEDVQIKERNVFVVLVNRNNDLLVENEWFQMKNLREKAKEFMSNPNNLETLPEKEPVQVPLLGEMMVSKGVISLRNDLDTKYGTYITVQNELIGAINELRDELAREKFGKVFSSCNEEQQNAIKEVFPSRISEAEPKRVGGR